MCPRHLLGTGSTQPPRGPAKAAQATEAARASTQLRLQCPDRKPCSSKLTLLVQYGCLQNKVELPAVRQNCFLEPWQGLEAQGDTLERGQEPLRIPEDLLSLNTAIHTASRTQVTDSSYPQEHLHVVSQSQPMNSITLSYGEKKIIKQLRRKRKTKKLNG